MKTTQQENQHAVESFSPKSESPEITGKPTLVLGASTNPARTSYTAINMLRDAGHTVYGVGYRPGAVRDVEIEKNPELTGLANVHTITLYLNAQRQEAYFDRILELAPERLIFNPGAENRALFDAATERGVECLNACTLVMLTHRMY